MSSNDAYILVLVTIDKEEVAKELAQGIVGGKLAACVNILPKAQSVYRWENKIETSEERLLLIKTRQPLFPELRDWIKKNHPYNVPEIIAITISDGYEPYLNWIGANTLFAKPRAAGRPGARRLKQGLMPGEA